MKDFAKKDCPSGLELDTPLPLHFNECGKWSSKSHVFLDVSTLKAKIKINLFAGRNSGLKCFMHGALVIILYACISCKVIVFFYRLWSSQQKSSDFDI